MFTKHLKTLVFISLGVLVFVIFGFFGTPRKQTADTTKKEKRPAEIPITPKKREKIGHTHTPPLADFQKTEFYRTIVDNNLFRPLGWRPPRPKDAYDLLGTLIFTDGKSEAQAILRHTTTGKTRPVGINDKLDTETTVIDIQAKQVTLETSGHQRNLKLNSTPFLK